MAPPCHSMARKVRQEVTEVTSPDRCPGHAVEEPRSVGQNIVEIWMFLVLFVVLTCSASSAAVLCALCGQRLFLAHTRPLPPRPWSGRFLLRNRSQYRRARTCALLAAGINRRSFVIVLVPRRNASIGISRIGVERRIDFYVGTARAGAPVNVVPRHACAGVPRQAHAVLRRGPRSGERLDDLGGRSIAVECQRS